MTEYFVVVKASMLKLRKPIVSRNSGDSMLLEGPRRCCDCLASAAEIWATRPAVPGTRGRQAVTLTLYYCTALHPALSCIVSTELVLCRYYAWPSTCFTQGEINWFSMFLRSYLPPSPFAKHILPFAPYPFKLLIDYGQ